MTRSDSAAEMNDWLHRAGAAFLRRFGIREGDRVLDFGCGPGGYALPLAQVVGANGSVTALDRSPTPLAELERRLAGSPLRDRVTVVRSDGGLLLDGVADASLDAALLFDVLQHVDDWGLLLSSLRRTLVENGLLLVNPSRLSHPGRVDLSRLETTLEEAGFGIERSARARVAHYDRVLEEEVLVCRAR